jgi:hypothetical protein
MMLAAWRKVGFAGGRIDATLVDRTHFIDRIEVASCGSPSGATRSITTKKVDEVAKTPEGVRGTSIAGMRAKFEAVTEYARMLETKVQALEAAPFDPETVPFLMTPKELTEKTKRDRSQVDMSVYEGGSASLRNLNGVFKVKRKKVAEKVAAVEGRKEVAAAKKTEATEAAAQLIIDFELCAEVCACGTSPCPMLGMKRCETCEAAGRPSIKPRICVVRECVAARKGPVPLTLTYVGPSSDLLELTYTATEAAEEEDAVEPGDEVMPVARPTAAVRLAATSLCCYACDDAVLTAEEVENGYCSGRRCKAKMHPMCFLHHAGEAGAALGDLVCFCQACWAAQ